MTNTHTNESGRSMIEMLGVLAIIGVLSVGGIAGYSQAMSKFKVSKTTDQVQTMVTNIRTLFAGQRAYTGLTGENAYTMGILTDETWDSTKKEASNAYGGTVTLSTADNAHQFDIGYEGIPDDACVRIIMSDWGDSSSGFVGLNVADKASTITATDKMKPTYNTAAKTFPIDLGTAVSACANDNANVIEWVYR